MPELVPYPELGEALVALQGAALLRKLRDDPALAAFFNGGIEDVEAETLLLQGGVQANFLGVALGPLTEDRTGNAQYATQTVAFDLFVVTKIEQTRGTNGWLRARVVNHVARVLQAEDEVAGVGGVLTDPEGNLLTEALTRFERLDFTGRLRNDPSLIVTPLRVVYTADFDQIGRTFIR